jgi:DNA-directed RNA polymerase subunit RPC12/RpoP
MPESRKEGEQILPGVVYECLSCATRVSGAELAKLPSPTCANCGYRAFKKVRGPAPKNLKAE